MSFFCIKQRMLIFEKVVLLETSMILQIFLIGWHLINIFYQQVLLSYSTELEQLVIIRFTVTC